LPSGYLSNANDLAQVLLVGLCFLPILLSNSKSMLRRGFVGAGVVFFLYVILSTGSRAALLTAVLVAVLGTLHTSAIRKFALIGAFCAVGIGTLLFAPGAARSRLATLFSDSQEDSTELDQIARESAAGRKNMLIDSIVLTLKHPLFGVGPGQFQSAEAEYTHLQGKRAPWLETHNTYTQVSSETGIPGFLIFGAAFWNCLRGLARIRKAVRNNPRLQPGYRALNQLWLGFIAFAVTCFFSSVAYQFYVLLFLGLCAGAMSAAERELSASLPQRSDPAQAGGAWRSAHPLGGYARIRG
jgi:O-antigen ligase